jgi:hypothetical protein
MSNRTTRIPPLAGGDQPHPDDWDELRHGTVKYYYLHSRTKVPTEADAQRVEAAWPDYVADWSAALEVAPNVLVHFIAFGEPGALIAVYTATCENRPTED